MDAVSRNFYRSHFRVVVNALCVDAETIDDETKEMFVRYFMREITEEQFHAFKMRKSRELATTAQFLN